MPEDLLTSANMDIFNRRVICQEEVYQRSLSNLKLCQKFLTLASRYYDINFPIQSVNLHKTLKLNRLKTESDCEKLVSCDKCFKKINSFCEIYEEVSLLRIHLDVTARKIAQLMKHSNNRNNATPNSQMVECFRNQFYSKVAVAHFPQVKLRKLVIDVPTLENDPLYIPTKNENSGNEDESDNAQLVDNHSPTESCRARAVPPPPPLIPRTGLTHQAKVDQVTKISKDTSIGCENLVVDSSTSESAAGNVVEMLKSLPQGSLLVVRGAEGIRNKPRKRRYKCRFCEKSFAKLPKRQKHENIHLQANHKEAKTEKKVSTMANITSNPHDAEKPFKCSICLKCFAKRGSLYQHKRIHTKGFHCDICSARFSAKNVLETHKRTHTGERPYLCPICFQTFPHHQTCKDHQRKIHIIVNGVVINTKAYGVKVVPENSPTLAKENQNVTPGNQSEHEIQQTEKLQSTNGNTANGDNFILPDTKQDFQIDLNEGEDAIVNTELSDPLGDV